MIQTTAAIGAATLFNVRTSRAQTPTINVLETRVISPDSAYYHGWPTVCRRSNGELWVSWSGGREGHICPFGRVDSMLSKDEGRTWTWPRTLLDGAIDDRDSGCLETAKGTLIVTTFTSLAYEARLKGKKTGLDEATHARWSAAHNRLTEEQRKAELGEWCIRSTDGGITWGPRIATIVNAPHGPIQLSDGRLLYAGKQLWATERKIGVAESHDDGLTWKWLAEIPARKGDSAHNEYHELHAVEVTPGHILAQIRNHAAANKGETLQAESTDGGRTWSEPRSIGVWGLPSHLLRLRDGRLQMTYGHRRAPFGNQARVSSDAGKTWSEPLIISGDGMGGDLGYPSTVELSSGELLTVWYESMKEPKGKAVLRQARWKLG
jgi:Neuraminidase (sialidase)